MRPFEQRLLEALISWFRNTSPESRRLYVEQRKARLSPEGRRIYDAMTRGLRRMEDTDYDY